MRTRFSEAAINGHDAPCRDDTYSSSRLGCAGSRLDKILVFSTCLSSERWHRGLVWSRVIFEGVSLGLDAGAAYRFRVRAVNATGAKSPPGRAVVVNTLLEAPAAPRLAQTPSGGVRRVGVTAETRGVSPGFAAHFAVSSTTATLAWPATRTEIKHAFVALVSSFVY